MTKPDDIHGNERALPKPKRCAIYARYSSDLQRPASIDDQIRKCRQLCERNHDWIIVEEWVLADREVSGRSLVGRVALAALKEAAKRKPRPFDCVIIDDTSRLGRNVPDVLKLAEVFEHYGVSIQFVSPSLHSGDPNFRQLLIFKSMMDEQYSMNLADKVWRGLEGRVLKGYNATGACYGYRTVEEKDPNGRGDGVLGVKLEIVVEQAKIVQRIFTMYANGSSFDRIARELRADGIAPPRAPHRKSVQAWSADGISEILRNKKYIGINEWGRRKNVYDPETGRTVVKQRPESEWVRCVNKEWRIVSDELWQKVQDEVARKRRHGIPKEGGLTRSRQYLFSGMMSCGFCGGSVRIVDGSGEIMRYGCGIHRDKGACANSATIRQDHLEKELLSWLTHDLLEGNRLDQATNAFHEQVYQRVSELQGEARKRAVNAPELRKELAQKQQEAWGLTDCLVENGRQSLPTVRARLAAAEARIAEIEGILARAKEPEPIVAFTAKDIKEHLLDKLRDLQSALISSPQIGKQTLPKYIGKITFTPGEDNGKRVLHVVVEFKLGGGNSGVVLTGSVDAFSQQYGFNTITVTGLAIDACRVYRKRAPLPILPKRNGAPPAASANMPNPNLAADSFMPANEAGAA
jgi:site-specific DNA recombinase